MDGGGIDPVAIYAALVSTVALGWQILKERRARRAQVEVDAGHAMLNFPGSGLVWAAQIEARNRSDLPVR